MSGESTVRRSLAWAAALSWGERATSTIFTIVLAAILGPEAFGIVAMALVYLAVVDLFLEQGFLTTIVQREQLDREHLDSAFWVNLAWCLVLTAASFGLAGWWASVNDVPELEDVIKVMSVLVVVTGLTIVQQAHLQRQLQFRKLAIRANIAALVGGIVGLALALSGAGVWSLVAQQITAGCIRSLLL
jgi:PST family polysaccharide transporter